MTRHTNLSSLCAGLVAAAALAAPAAFATDIVKCVDTGGHITLTDQPCETGSASMPVERGPDTIAAASQRRMDGKTERERYVLPVVDQGAWKRPDLSRAAPLNRDVATLREARRTLLMQDAKGSLAGLP